MFNTKKHIFKTLDNGDLKIFNPKILYSIIDISENKYNFNWNDYSFIDSFPRNYIQKGFGEACYVFKKGCVVMSVFHSKKESLNDHNKKVVINLNILFSLMAWQTSNFLLDSRKSIIEILNLKIDRRVIQDNYHILNESLIEDAPWPSTNVSILYFEKLHYPKSSFNENQLLTSTYQNYRFSKNDNLRKFII